MNDIEKAIEVLNRDIMHHQGQIDRNEEYGERYIKGEQQCIDSLSMAISALEQPTATEFLNKAKAICDIEGIDLEIMFNIIDCIGRMPNALSEADLVRKVMEYQLPDDAEDFKAEYEESMKRDYDLCDMCPDNQLNTCPYIENDDRKSCPKVMDYKKEADTDA